MSRHPSRTSEPPAATAAARVEIRRTRILRGTRRRPTGRFAPAATTPYEHKAGMSAGVHSAWVNCPFLTRTVSRQLIPAVRRPVRGPPWEVRLIPLRRLAFIGNSLPRRCGIATFTTDLQLAISKSRLDVETAIVAMNDHGAGYDYPA